MTYLRPFAPADWDTLLDLANTAVPFAPAENAEWLAYRRAFRETERFTLEGRPSMVVYRLAFGDEVEFPDLSEFRASITLEGEPLSETVIDERRQARS